MVPDVAALSSPMVAATIEYSSDWRVSDIGFDCLMMRKEVGPISGGKPMGATVVKALRSVGNTLGHSLRVGLAYSASMPLL